MKEVLQNMFFFMQLSALGDQNTRDEFLEELNEEYEEIREEHYESLKVWALVLMSISI